jgi:hypothetical protein
MRCKHLLMSNWLCTDLSNAQLAAALQRVKGAFVHVLRLKWIGEVFCREVTQVSSMKCLRLEAARQVDLKVLAASLA